MNRLDIQSTVHSSSFTHGNASARLLAWLPSAHTFPLLVPTLQMWQLTTHIFILLVPTPQMWQLTTQWPSLILPLPHHLRKDWGECGSTWRTGSHARSHAYSHTLPFPIGPHPQSTGPKTENMGQYPSAGVQPMAQITQLPHNRLKGTLNL